MADFYWRAGLDAEPLRLDVVVDLGEDATAEELDEAARLLRGELADAGWRGGAGRWRPGPEGTARAGGFLAGR
jgi:hypothetical protein